MRSNSFPGSSPILAISATIGASCAVGGLVFISFGEVVEVVVDIEVVDLFADRSLHVDLGIGYT